MATLIHNTQLIGVDDADVVALEERVLSNISELGLKLNLDKCEFYAPELVHLGYVIRADELRMVEDREAALRNAQPPYDVTSLKSFMVKIGFYERFLSHRAEVCAPRLCPFEKMRGVALNHRRTHGFPEREGLAVE